jgi:hypothetical protein
MQGPSLRAALFLQIPRPPVDASTLTWASPTGTRSDRLRFNRLTQAPSSSLPEIADLFWSASSALIRCTVLEPTPCALIVLRRLRPASRSRRIAASFDGGIRGRPTCLPRALARASRVRCGVRTVDGPTRFQATASALRPRHSENPSEIGFSKPQESSVGN